MNDGIKMDFTVHFTTGPAGQRVMKPGPQPAPAAPPPGPVPRIARLMALAIRFDELVRSGEVEDFAALAELGHVTRARMSQIVNLLNLAPDIQEAVLALGTGPGDAPRVTERQVRSIAGEPDWSQQRDRWRSIAS